MACRTLLAMVVLLALFASALAATNCGGVTSRSQKWASGHVPGSTGAAGGPTCTGPDCLRLTGTIRDFRPFNDFQGLPGGHKDFEDPCCGSQKNMVLPGIGVDPRRPIYNSGITQDFIKSGAGGFDYWYRNYENDASPCYSTEWFGTYAIDLHKDSDGMMVFDSGFGWFPLTNAAGFGYSDRYTGENNIQQNFHFTYAITGYTFTYDPAQSQKFSFCGDDDVWVFIHDKLAVDLGGVHGKECQDINIKDFLNANVAGFDDTVLSQHSWDFFWAERHVVQSNFRLFFNFQVTCPNAGVGACADCHSGTCNCTSSTPICNCPAGCNVTSNCADCCRGDGQKTGGELCDPVAGSDNAVCCNNCYGYNQGVPCGGTPPACKKKVCSNGSCNTVADPSKVDTECSAPPNACTIYKCNNAGSCVDSTIGKTCPTVAQGFASGAISGSQACWSNSVCGNGACTFTPKSDNTLCGGDLCSPSRCKLTGPTKSECVAQTPVVCPVPTECFSQPSCNTSTGTCPNPMALPGATDCSPPNCEAQCCQCVVSGTDKSCLKNNDRPCDADLVAASKGCMTAATCSDGHCTHQNAPSTKSCSDDLCFPAFCDGNGACVADDPVTCPNTPEECQGEPVCNSVDGSCGYANKTVGAPCTPKDGIPVGAACQFYTCTPDMACLPGCSEGFCGDAVVQLNEECDFIIDYDHDNALVPSTCCNSTICRFLEEGSVCKLDEAENYETIDIPSGKDRHDYLKDCGRPKCSLDGHCIVSLSTSGSCRNKGGSTDSVGAIAGSVGGAVVAGGAAVVGAAAAGFAFYKLTRNKNMWADIDLHQGMQGAASNPLYTPSQLTVDNPIHDGL